MGLFQGLIATCLVASTLCAAGVSGEWTAVVGSRHGTFTEITLNLKAEDDLLTGTVRGSAAEVSITNGVIDDDNISFDVITETDGYQITERYRGTLEDDVIHFSVTVHDGRSMSHDRVDFTAKRVS